jgi:hypothetical protein
MEQPVTLIPDRGAGDRPAMVGMHTFEGGRRSTSSTMS